MLFAALSIVLALAAYFLTQRASGEWTMTTAVVERVGDRDTNSGANPYVVVRFDDGTRREIGSTPAALKNCHAGSRISLVRKGPYIDIGMRGCLPDR